MPLPCHRLCDGNVAREEKEERREREEGEGLVGKGFKNSINRQVDTAITHWHGVDMLMMEWLKGRREKEKLHKIFLSGVTEK